MAVSDLTRLEKFVAISPFACSEDAGHPIIDDQFYFSYLLDRNVDFIYYTSEASARLILTKHPGMEGHLRMVRPYRASGLGHLDFARQLIIPRDATVIFFLYTEPLVLTWYLLNVFKPFSLFLVSSNNVSARRVRIYPYRFRIFFKTIMPKLSGVVLDSKFQVELLRGISTRFADHCFVRKNHLMSPQHIKVASKKASSISIGYFGPDKPEKPLSTLIELIKADVRKQFRYFIYNVPIRSVTESLDVKCLPSNVMVDSAWQTHEAYLQNYTSVDLVMLTHTRDFEGKLSGNLCDCVALGVPYIALSIEPAKSLHSQYGGPGYLCDFDSTDWTLALLKEINKDSLLRMQQQIRIMAEDYSINSVRRTLDDVFKIGGR